MSDPTDPFELLRKCNPVHPDRVADASATPEADQTLNQIIAGTYEAAGQRRQPKSRQRLVRRRSLIFVLVPVAGLIAAVAFALTQGPSTRLTVGCYATADLHARTIVVPTRPVSAVESCREVWRRGAFNQALTSQLQACVLPSGAIGVFPSRTRTACHDLKLAPLTNSQTPPGTSSGTLIPFKNALTRAFLKHRCLTARQAIAVVAVEIHRFRLTGWSTAINGTFIRERPCASLAFDENTHRVLLVPMPKTR